MLDESLLTLVKDEGGDGRGGVQEGERQEGARGADARGGVRWEGAGEIEGEGVAGVAGLRKVG